MSYPSTAKAALGTTLKIDGTLIAEITDVTPGGTKRSFIEVSNHESVGYKEYVGGLNDAGEFPFSANFLAGDAGQLAHIAAVLATTPSTYVVTFPGGTTFTCTGYAAGWTITAPHDNRIGFTGTVRITGTPVIA